MGRFEYLLFSIVVAVFIPQLSQAEQGDGPRCLLMTSAVCRGGSSEDGGATGTSTCRLSYGIGVPAQSTAGFSYCKLQSCNAGYQRRGETCVRAFQIRNCTVANGRGTQESYGGLWSTCKIATCNRGFVNFRGVCQAPLRLTARACPIFAGRGRIRFIAGNQSFCKVDACAAGYEARGNTCVKRNAPNARVNLVIIRNSDGTGNAKWNNTYIRRMIDQMTDSTRGNVRFHLGWVKHWNSTEDYANPDQDGVKNKFLNFREFGAITAVVTQPSTRDSVGTAIGISYNYEPLMMIRSKYNNASLQDSSHAGAVLLHELGHNMGMRHNYDKDVNMDSHYYLTPTVLQNYVLGLNRCTIPNEVCLRNYSKFGSPYSSMSSNRYD